MADDDRVFKALADPTRRRLLDRLFARDGRTLSDLESDVEMTRFGVMKHLRLLEDAELIVSRRSGREKLHFLNVVPIQLIHDRWIDKYASRQVTALADLKSELEQSNTQSHRVYARCGTGKASQLLRELRRDSKYDIPDSAQFSVAEAGRGVCTITVTVDTRSGFDWPLLLSDLKTLLETGSSLYG